MSRVDILRPDGPGILFKHEELQCQHTGQVVLATGFAEKLAMLRMSYGKPMKVTSCCRSAFHNEAIGGHPRSLHVFDTPYHPTGGTAAIDIAVSDPAEALELGRKAISQGWSVGVPRAGFIHLDRRDLAGLPQGLFGYGG